jgi:hypothetical protein
VPLFQGSFIGRENGFMAPRYIQTMREGLLLLR